jgi:hypothetical protein
MVNDKDTYPYLIPLIWQGDTAHASPNMNPRMNLYNVPVWPTTMFGGTIQVQGSPSAQFRNAYNSIVAIPSSIEISINAMIDAAGENVTITADLNRVAELTDMNNTNVIFIMTYNLDDLLGSGANYFASVVRYAQQPLTVSDTYTHTFALRDSWEYKNTNIIVMIQNLGGDRAIYNARKSRLFDIFPPDNIRLYSSSTRVTVVWDKPDSDSTILGYNIYKNNQRLNVLPITDTYFTDYKVVGGQTYRYHVSTVFAHTESERTEEAVISIPNIENNFIQIGHGDTFHSNNSAGPINIFQQSNRCQFILTSEELHYVGLPPSAEIYSFGFYIHNAPNTTLPNYHVRFGHTNLDLPTEHLTPTMTARVIDDYLPVVNTWGMIELTTNFAWDGTGNMLIDTAFDRTASTASRGQVRTTPLVGGMRFVRANTTSQIDGVTTNLQDYRPKVRMFYNLDEPFVLNSPKNLDITLNSTKVTLTWQSPDSSNATFVGYRVYRNGQVLIATPTSSTTFEDTLPPSPQIYDYVVTAIYREGESGDSNKVSTGIVSESDIVAKPTLTQLGGNYPNPFNPNTTIYFDLHENTNVRLEVFNIRGQVVRTLANNHFEAGRHFIIWDGTDNSGRSAASGIYFYRLDTMQHSETRKMIMIK